MCCRVPCRRQETCTALAPCALHSNSLSVPAGLGRNHSSDPRLEKAAPCLTLAADGVVKTRQERAGNISARCMLCRKLFLKAVIKNNASPEHAREGLANRKGCSLRRHSEFPRRWRAA